jgi:hypothetical protein
MVVLGNPILFLKLKPIFKNQFGYFLLYNYFIIMIVMLQVLIMLLGFQEALLVSIDGSGDGISIQISDWHRKAKYKRYTERNDQIVWVFFIR